MDDVRGEATLQHLVHVQKIIQTVRKCRLKFDMLNTDFELL